MSKNGSDWGNGFSVPPQSYWTASVPETDYPSLNEDIKVDVAIAGGGMAGITTAWLLKNEGLKVAILEAGRILKGTTGHTTAKVTSQHGLIYHKIQTQLGEEKARQYAKANEQAIDFIERLAAEKNIDCDFQRCPAYVYTENDKYIKNIEGETVTAQSLGIEASYLDQLSFPSTAKAAVRFDNQA